jgi:Kdo2-lipid IVA lauroyltransferase/acyltransferase
MFLIRLLSKLPLRTLYILSDFLFVVSFYLVRYRRGLVKKNLRRSFPEKSVAELRNIEKEFYRNLCDYSVETLKLLSISKEELSERMVFTNNQILDEFKKKNQSILFLASHQFNWEWLMVSASISFPILIDFIYQPVSSKMFDQLSLELRSRFGAYPIKRDEVAREFIRRKNIVKGIASVADQYPGLGRDKKYLSTFLHQETAFFYGTNQLAILTQYPTLFYRIKRVKRGYYEASPVVIAEPPFEKDSDYVLEKYVREVEKLIQDHPAGWLWSHNRWKKRHLKK